MHHRKQISIDTRYFTSYSLDNLYRLQKLLEMFQVYSQGCETEKIRRQTARRGIAKCLDDLWQLIFRAIFACWHSFPDIVYLQTWTGCSLQPKLTVRFRSPAEVKI